MKKVLIDCDIQEIGCQVGEEEEYLSFGTRDREFILLKAFFFNEEKN